MAELLHYFYFFTSHISRTSLFPAPVNEVQMKTSEYTGTETQQMLIQQDTQIDINVTNVCQDIEEFNV